MEIHESNHTFSLAIGISNLRVILDRQATKSPDLEEALEFESSVA